MRDSEVLSWLDRFANQLGGREKSEERKKRCERRYKDAEYTDIIEEISL